MLTTAAKNGYINKINRLLDEGVDINSVDIKGVNGLMLASAYSNSSSSLDVVKLLLNRGADVNAKDNGGQTALMFASYSSSSTSSLETVKLLLDRGADVNIKSNIGKTALIFSSAFGSTETVKLLLDRGADINAKMNNGSNALMFAANLGNSPETIKLLLNEGADPFDKKQDGEYALDVCSFELCRRIISKSMWDRMYENVKLLSKKYSNKYINKDIWELILLRHRQQALCKDLSIEENKYILKGFAEMLDIPITGDISKRELCTIISKQLSYGGKYGESSVQYMKRKDTIKNLVELAKSLGINTDQPIDKILSEISNVVKL